MAHESLLHRPDGLVPLAYLLFLPASAVTLAVLAVVAWRGPDRAFDLLRAIAVALAVAFLTGVAVVVGVASVLGTAGATTGVALATPLVVGIGGGAAFLRFVDGMATADAVGYATAGTAAGIVPGTVAGGLLLVAWGALVGGTVPAWSGVVFLVLLAVVAGIPAAVGVFLGRFANRRIDPIPDGRRVLIAGLAVGLLAVPTTAALYPQVPVGTTPPEYPDRPGTLTNRSVAEYAAEYEETRKHLGPGRSAIGCSGRVVNRSVAAAYVAGLAVPGGPDWTEIRNEDVREADDPEERREARAEALREAREDLPESEGYFVAADCAGPVYHGGPLSFVHGDAFYTVVYFVDEGTTRRLERDPN